jgi:hypothetical protein
MAKNTNPDRKALALRQQGALNPHPEQVTDELFLTNEFSMPATSSRSGTRCCAVSAAMGSR